MKRKVYVVSDSRDGSGGFAWFYNQADAEEAYDNELEIWRDGEMESTIRLVVAKVPRKLTSERITRYLDARIEELEVTLPALKEAVVR